MSPPLSIKAFSVQKRLGFSNPKQAHTDEIRCTASDLLAVVSTAYGRLALLLAQDLLAVVKASLRPSALVMDATNSAAKIKF